MNILTVTAYVLYGAVILLAVLAVLVTLAALAAAIAIGFARRRVERERSLCAITNDVELKDAKITEPKSADVPDAIRP